MHLCSRLRVLNSLLILIKLKKDQKQQKKKLCDENDLGDQPQI